MNAANVAGSGRARTGACLIGVSLAASALGAQAGAPDAGGVTFTKDVAPILQRSCQVCHRPGQMAPMSLLTYEETRPWARAIRDRVARREMPPWHLDRTVGIREYVNDRSLTDAEIAVIVRWADAGAPRGDPADLPPPAAFAPDDAWYIGTPDLIVTMEEEMVVAAQGPDTFVNVLVPSGLTEDRYIRAIEVHPGDRRVVHHVNTFAIQEPETPGDNGLAGFGNVALPGEVWLKETSIGNSGDIYPEGTGRLLRAGAVIRFNIHYHPVGEEAGDRTSIAFRFYPRGEKPEKALVTRFITARNLDIPAGARDVRHDGYWTLPQPAQIVHFRPHMHYRGQGMRLEAVLPDGRTELLTSVPRYDVNWQLTYTYETPPAFPAGTVMHMTSYHDNSVANRNNPDPTMWTGSGSRTIDEMAIAHTDWLFLTDAEYRRIASARATDQQ